MERGTHSDTQARPVPILIRFCEAATTLSGAISVLGVLVMAVIVCYEVFVRYALNSPTSWVTEIATYMLVAVTFLGLAAAQRARAHIQVELVINSLDEARRTTLQIVANWIGLYFALFCLWQVAAFNYRDYINDTRDWGLLSTPQWIPEIPLTVGFFLFSVSLVAESYRLSPPRNRLAFWLAQIGLVVLTVLLIALGPYPVPIGGSRFDWGSVAISALFAAMVLSWSGWRIGLTVLAILGAFGLVFWLAQGASLLLLGVVLTLAILTFLLLGVRIALALGLVGLFGVFFLLPKPQLTLVAERAWSSINSFTLTAVPMFVLMSVLLFRSGVTTKMFDSLVRWFGRTPGGLAHASVGASAMFAAVCGSSIATAAALGRVSCPDMISRGYSPRLTYGVTAAGATLGIMIPPSIAMIIYGSTVGAPIDVLFIAGIVPGLLLAAGFMGAAFVWSVAVPGAAPKTDAYTWGEKMRSLASLLPFASVIIAVLGSLFMGIATPTEAASLGAAMSLILCVVYKRFSWRALYDAATETVSVTSFIMLIVVGASILSWAFDYLRLPHALVEMAKDANVAPWLVVAMVSLIYIVLGMFVESISMMLMTIPVAFPLMMALGFDPIWFGIYLVIMVECGLITPPVGIILFVLRGVSGDVPLREIAYGALPFVGIILAFVVVMFSFPELIAWLPKLMASRS